MENTRIRPATCADKGEWLRMRLALWPDDTDEQLDAEMAKLLDDPETAVFVAERRDGRLGGFIEAGTRPYAEHCHTSPVGYIEGWYVDTDLRRQGVGSLLVRAAEDWARARGLREMASDTWLDNEISFHSHLALGYQESERLIHFRKTL
jgi:aminoglycoside 6'-N-acetyltransferase I